MIYCVPWHTCGYHEVSGIWVLVGALVMPAVKSAITVINPAKAHQNESDVPEDLLARSVKVIYYSGVDVRGPSGSLGP
jgi:hypothetical protein